MSNRIIAFSAAAALAASAASAAALFLATPASAGEAVAASTVDGPQVAIKATAADFAATQSPGTVGAMHYAVSGRATNVDEVRREGGQATAATVRWLAAPVQPAS